MKFQRPFIPYFLSLILLLSFSSFSLRAENNHSEESEHQKTMEKGPQGGRLFKEGNTALELLIFERGMPPRFRAYLYQNGKMISPDKAHLTVELTRFNDKKRLLPSFQLRIFYKATR